MSLMLPGEADVLVHRPHVEQQDYSPGEAKIKNPQNFELKENLEIVFVAKMENWSNSVHT